MSPNTNPADNANKLRKPRLLCLHGKYQNASTFSNKIAGARRKLSREYELIFMDGPIVLQEGFNGAPVSDDGADAPRSWWLRSEDEKTHVLVREALEYVIEQTDVTDVDAILGFSQGGTLATALALSGSFPNLKCVVTSGAPFVREAFDKAAVLAKECGKQTDEGLSVPKFHMAGQTDTLVPAVSTQQLCREGGNGTFHAHEQGHLFPTRSEPVQKVLSFLAKHII
jgi:predicted esterase